MSTRPDKLLDSTPTFWRHFFRHVGLMSFSFLAVNTLSLLIAGDQLDALTGFIIVVLTGLLYAAGEYDRERRLREGDRGDANFVGERLDRRA
jgi:hypothetical protein